MSGALFGGFQALLFRLSWAGTGRNEGKVNERATEKESDQDVVATRIIHSGVPHSTLRLVPSDRGKVPSSVYEDGSGLESSRFGGLRVWGACLSADREPGAQLGLRAGHRVSEPLVRRWGLCLSNG